MYDINALSHHFNTISIVFCFPIWNVRRTIVRVHEMNHLTVI